MSVVELGYLGLDVSDLSAWQRFATQIAGFQYVSAERGGAHLRMDYWHYRIALHEGRADDLAYVGFRVSDEDALAALADRLRGAGYEFATGSPAEEDERCVMGLLKMHSPGGIPVEVFWGPQVDAHRPWHPGRPMHGRFKTGSAGLGHVALREPDGRAAYEFYKLLGFKGGPEYKLKLPNGFVAKPIFMHCNERQHTLQFDLGPMEKRLHHVMIEYDDLNDVGLAHDLVQRHGMDIGMQLGKHANDHALSFYVGTPSRWLLELGCNVRSTPAHAEHSQFDLFGHALGVKGYGLEGFDLVGR
ncbi:MAG: VOC family protein [Steroidobacteraceae bacterium]